MRVIRRSAFEKRPWRNGGGISHEIAWHSDDDWRLSLAEIARGGPFSDYSGFDRTLTPIGGGLRLNGRPVGPEPFSFRGEDVVEAALDSGAMLAFNVITRRGAVAHAVRRVALDAPRKVTADFVLVLGGTVSLGGERLGLLDAAETEGTPVLAVPETAAELAEVTLHRL
ncbi:HutD/Ves family protein [Sabulicella glaciei]|uniref:HutD family protein n=1 Tax=Sabulicella glaciei TaxID=2984948 RepID=A0ABT3NQG0_9PROT|nr:HutD family protein [Roseococcus sp. MDT2-1-1]MCW8084362.1 HutD family protein [Roseococcus sp. MDT2-1-1]